ncbi:MAG: peroxiredoxin family protein [Spirochaetia bacterium]|nr:peroxiredoxin family protein [Spirochaetia bacterium]
MYFVKKYFIYVSLVLFLINCSNPVPLSNLFPDATDRRYLNVTGLQPGDRVPDITFYNTDGTTDTLSNILTIKNGVVIYFTMWCIVCDVHMSYIRNTIKPMYPNVEFYLLDYVSGTIAQALANQTGSGYTDFKAALDKNFKLTDMFYGTMSTTIVIDKNSILRMNEDFKDGQRLSAVLSVLP